MPVDKDGVNVMTREEVVRVLNRESKKMFGCSWLEAKKKKEEDGRHLVNHVTCAPLIMISQLLREDDEYWTEYC